MNRYITRRLLQLPLALLLVHTAGFAYAHLVRLGQLAHNPFRAASGETAPLFPTYLDYLHGLLRLDFGALPPAGAPVGRLLLEATIASLGLLGLAFMISVILGIGLGVAAVRTPRQRGRDGTSQPADVAPWLTMLTTAGLAMPGFYIGSLLILLILRYLIWGPTAALLPVQGFGWDLHLVLPTLVLAARPAAQIAQMTAALLAAELDKMYIMAARGVGVSWRVIRRRHALRNIIAPLTAVIFGAFRLVIGELIVVEWIFSWPGLGRLLAMTLILPQASNTARPMFLHPPTLAGVLTILALLFQVGDLVSGLVGRSFDPRLRAETQRTEGGAYD